MFICLDVKIKRRCVCISVHLCMCIYVCINGPKRNALKQNCVEMVPRSSCMFQGVSISCGSRHVSFECFVNSSSTVVQHLQLQSENIEKAHTRRHTYKFMW